MRRRTIALLTFVAACVAQGGEKAASVSSPARPPAPWVLLDANDAAEHLSERDDFVKALSALDRQLRLRSETPVDEQAFLSFARAQARDFEEAERAHLERALSELGSRIDQLGLRALLLEPVTFARTTGDEEGADGFDLTYTRAGVVFLNEKALAEKDLVRALAHELFHVITFRHKALRDELYALLGFQPAPSPRFSEALEALRLTGPEAPRAEHALTLHSRARELLCVAFVWSSNAKYRGGGFSSYATPTWAVLNKEYEAQAFVTVRELPELATLLQRNTTYLAGPEEILADNFALLVRSSAKVDDQALLDRMHAVAKRFAQRTN